MRVLDTAGLTLADCGLPCDTFNAACRARLPGTDLAARVDAAIRWFDGRPFSWWLCPGDRPPALARVLEDAGLAAAETELAMTCDLAVVADGPATPLAIKGVRSPADLGTFARLLAALWSPPDPHVIAYYDLVAPALLHEASPVRLYLGWLDDEPVGTAEATLGGGVAGLYNISVADAHRHRGFGTALTTRPLLEARAAGCRLGVLQAAPGAVGVYRRVGFRDAGEITEYKPR